LALAALPAFLATPDPSATVSPSTAFPGAPVIRPTLLQPFLAGTRTVSPVARRVLVTVLSLPPRRSGPSRQPACDGPCGLRPPVAGSASGASHFRGHLCVPLRYGPVTRLPSRGWRCRWAFGSWFPSTRPSKLRGVWLLPRWDYLPLNAPAFAGRTTGRAELPHPALRLVSHQGPRRRRHARRSQRPDPQFPEDPSP